MAQQIGPASGHARPARSSRRSPPGPMHGWGISLRIQQVSRRRAPGQPGIALSRAPSPRAAGTDRGRVGQLREQPPGEVLPADEDAAASSWPKRPATGSGCRTRSRACSRTEPADQGDTIMLRRIIDAADVALPARPPRARARRRAPVPPRHAHRAARPRRAAARRGAPRGAPQTSASSSGSRTTCGTRGCRGCSKRSAQDVRYGLRICGAIPASRSSSSPRWRSASAPTPRSSASSTASCCGRCPTRTATALVVLRQQQPLAGVDDTGFSVPGDPRLPHSVAQPGGHRRVPQHVVHPARPRGAGARRDRRRLGELLRRARRAARASAATSRTRTTSRARRRC